VAFSPLDGKTLAWLQGTLFLFPLLLVNVRRRRGADEAQHRRRVCLIMKAGWVFQNASVEQW